MVKRNFTYDEKDVNSYKHCIVDNFIHREEFQLQINKM